MKIGFLMNISINDINSLKQGVIGEYFLFDLVTEITKHNNEVVLISISYGIDKDAIYSIGEKIKVYLLKPLKHGNVSAFFNFKYEISKLVKILRKEHCDIIHAHWCYWFAKAALKYNAKKTIVTIHDWPDVVCPMVGNYYWKKWQKLGNSVLENGLYFTAVSEYIKELHKKKYGEKEIHIIPNFMKLPEIKETQTKCENKNFKIVSVNNGFGKRKNVENLIKAFALVRKTYPESELLLCGDGFEDSGIAFKWAASQKLEKGIQFLGAISRKEVLELIKTADVLVHPSLEESFGMTLIEAMAMKTYVIGGQSSGAVPWILRQGKYGTLVDVKDENEIVKAICFTIENPKVVEKIINDAYRYVFNVYSLDVVAKEYLNLYHIINNLK